MSLSTQLRRPKIIVNDDSGIIARGLALLGDYGASASDRDRAEAAAIQAESFGKLYEQTDAQMLLVEIDADVDLINRRPSAASPDQVAIVGEYSQWARVTPPVTEPYFETADGGTWIQVGYRQSEVLSVVHSALAGAYGSVRDFSNRTAVTNWIALNPAPAVGSLLRWAGVVVRYTGTGTVIPDMPGYVPDGTATIVHYGGGAFASSATNLSAINTALANNRDVVLPRVTGATYAFSGQIRITSSGTTLRGDSPQRTAISFDDTFDGPCILFEPSDPLASSYVGTNSISNLFITGNNSTRTTRTMLDIRKQEQFQARNLRWTGFSFGINIAGGQFIYVDDVYGFGSGLGAGLELADSFQIRVTQAATSGSPQVNYNTFISSFNLGGGSGKNIKDMIRIEQADGLSIRRGYVAFAARSLLRLDGISGAGIGAVRISDVYFDGVYTTPGSGVPHVISVKDDIAVGKCDLEFIGGYMGNTEDEILALGDNNNLGDVTFTGVRINNSQVGIGTIKGQPSATNGLRIAFAGGSFANAPLGLEISGAQTVSVDGTFEDIDDATGALKLTGTIRQKRVAANISNCVAGVSDTSTGENGKPDYEWIRNRVIGTVGFAGGVNTGDIFETITGANGTALKFADGTMICYHQGSMGSVTASGAGTLADPYRTAAFVWSLPATFSSPPRVMGSCHNASTSGVQSAVYLTTLVAPLTSEARFIAVRSTSNATADVMTGEFTAIGRWRT